jgi:UDP-sulfoquinovose synthase
MKILPASFWNKKRAEECADLDPSSIKISDGGVKAKA